MTRKYTERYPKYKQADWLTQLCEKEARNVWEELDWKAMKIEIEARQMEIVKSFDDGDMDRVYYLQEKLVRLDYAGWWAVRKVSTGDKKEGIDQQKWDTYGAKVRAFYQLSWLQRKLGRYKPSAVKRVWIPKGNTGKLRPLGIPTMLDRAFQGLLLNALEPIHEHTADENSFGFRKRRGAHHAISRLRALLGQKPSSRWVLDADIQQCFDSISHETILSKVVCWDIRVIKKVIRAPIVDYQWKNTASPKLCVYPVKGTPQGGLVSPLFCNLALDGIEQVIMDATPKRKYSDKKNKWHTVRYADDLMATALNRSEASKIKLVLSQFLLDRGLTLNDSKTAEISIRKGVEYLSWEIRLRRRKGSLNKKHSKWDWVLVIRPSRKSVKSLRESIISCFQKWEKKGFNPYLLTVELNQITRGWCMYFRYSYHSLQTFKGIGNIVWRRMLVFLKKKHSRRPTEWIVEKYNSPTESRKWSWRFTNKKGRTVRLFDPTGVKHIQQNPHAFKQSYYTKEGREWWDRQAQSVPKSMAMVKLRKEVYALYAGRCGLCGELLTDEGNEWLKLTAQSEKIGIDPQFLWNSNPSGIELHRIVTGREGGKYVLENVMPVHSHCHTAWHRLNPLQAKDTTNS